MAKRSITNQEIALVKAMLKRGMKNKDIQFYFNRPERAMNTGRISTIKKGTYSNASTIPPASDEELRSFLDKFASGIKQELSLEDRVRLLFQKSTDGRWYLKSGESDQYECKIEFDPKKLSPVIRAVAALANNKGGYIFFGVADRTFRVEGIDQTFSKTDIVHIVDKIKAHLSPTPAIISKDSFEFEGRTLGVLHVALQLDRPVIVYRDGEKLSEGEIIFRYPGQSSRIKFGDLRSMLDDRDKRAQQSLAVAARRLANVGTENALIVDTRRNVIEAQGRSILIDEKLASDLKFIKEGHFDEKKGAPTLRLIGDVSPVSVGSITKVSVSKEAIFQETIVDDFLEQVGVAHPIQYIQAGLAQSRMWLPVFYYVRLAGITNTQAAETIRSLKVAQKKKKEFLIERLEEKRTAWTKSITQAAKKIAVEISGGKISTPTKVQDVPTFANGITAVEATTASKESLIESLKKCLSMSTKAENAQAISSVYKAICRIDEIFFGGF